MGRTWISTVAVVFIIAVASPSRAQQSAPVDGLFSIGGHDYKLTQGVAYETKSGDFDLVTVLVSNTRLPVTKIQQSLAKNQSDEDVSLSQPYVKLTFNNEGELQFLSGWADNSSFSMGGSDVKVEFKLDDGRVRGKADLAKKPDSASQRSFAFRFDLPLGLGGAAPAKPKSAGPVKPTVTGKFTGNGKPAKLAFVSAHPTEGLDDRPAIQLVFTEKDHFKNKKPEIEAGFGHFGSALIISIADDGSIFGCEVAHAAHAKKPFSSLGTIRTEEFELGENFVKGKITTDGEQDALDQKWEVDLTFVAPLAGMPASAAAKPVKPKAPAATPAPKPAVASLNVHDLPLPKDATDIEYKEIVEQLVFKSPTKVQALANDLQKKLAAQGWKGGGDDDLVTAQSAILERKRGEATLTIMVNKEGNGSEVKVFSTGLTWDEKEEK